MKKKLLYSVFLLSLYTFNSCKSTKVQNLPIDTVPEATSIEPQTNATIVESPINDDPQLTIMDIAEVEPVKVDIIDTNDTIFANDNITAVIVSDEPLMTDKTIKIVSEDDTNVSDSNTSEDTVFLQSLDSLKILEDATQPVENSLCTDDKTLAILNEEDTIKVDTKIGTSETSTNPYVYDEVEATNSENTEAQSIKNNKSIEISQNLNVINGEYFNISMAGKGWIYLGETDTTKNSTEYIKRVYDNEDTLFKFKALDTGVVVLHYYKQDLIKEEYRDEYVQVTISNTVTPEQQINLFSDKQENILTESNANIFDGTDIINEEPVLTSDMVKKDEIISIPEDTNINKIADSMNADKIFATAQNLYNEGDYKMCLVYLDKFFINSVSDIEKGWYLRGQAYEKNSDIKDIKKALEAYEKLVDFFPDSNLWELAQNRIKYINRFYYNIH